MKLILAAPYLAEHESAVARLGQALDSGRRGFEVALDDCNHDAVAFMQARLPADARLESASVGIAIFPSSAAATPCPPLRASQGADSVGQVERALERAADMRIPLLSCPASFLDGGGESPRSDDRLHRLRSRLSSLRHTAEWHGVRLALLVGDERGDQAGLPPLLRDAISARDFIDELATPWVALSLAVAMPAERSAVRDWIDICGARLAALRVWAPGEQRRSMSGAQGFDAAAGIAAGDEGTSAAAVGEWMALAASMGFEGCLIVAIG